MTSEVPKLYWTGHLDPDCQVCHQPFGTRMYDAPYGGPWGNICQQCFDRNGNRLGIGKGQAYDLQADGRWLCVGGR